MIATGSHPSSLPGITIDENRIVSSTGALSLETLPKKLSVIGAGYIGIELGMVWARLGAEVEVIEYLPRILPGMDSEIAKKFMTIAKKQGLKFLDFVTMKNCLLPVIVECALLKWKNLQNQSLLVPCQPQKG